MMTDNSTLNESLVVKQVEDLYNLGQFRQAYSTITAYSHTHTITDYRLLLFAARASRHLGDNRIGDVTVYRLHKSQPDNSEISLFRAYQILARQGPWQA